MSRASNLAKAIGADGTLNVSDVAGLAAVASSGSASDLSTGTLPIARIADGAVTSAKIADGTIATGDIADANVTAAKLASGAAVSNIGYTPVNKAGDTMSGPLGVGVFTVGANSGEARLGRANDRSVGVATVQLGGSSAQRFEIVDRGWTKVLLSTTDAGVTTVNGTLGVSGYLASSSGSTYVPAGGTLAFNIEALFGNVSSGLLIVTGNENGVNGTIRTYSWNHTFYGYSSNTRYVRIKAIDSNQIANGYGDVYAYLGSNAASYTSLDQSASGTATTTSDIYFRNAVGQGCIVSWTIWRT